MAKFTMKTHGTLSLVAIGLIGLAALETLWLKPKREQKEEGTKKPFQLKDTHVSQITLNDGLRRFIFECADQAAKLCRPGDSSKWKLITPSPMKADDSNVNALLSAINNLQANDQIDLSQDKPEKRAQLLKDYRLDPQSRLSASTRRVTIKPVTGDELVLFMGETHPLGDSHFSVAGTGHENTAKIKDETVYLIPTFFKANFDHDLTYWRDKKLFSLGAHQVQAFKMEGPKGTFEGKRIPGGWEISSTQGAKTIQVAGDSENIESLLTAATYLAAKGFLAEKKDSPQGKAGLKSTARALALTLVPEGKAEPITLSLFEKKAKGKIEKLYATLSTSDPIYEMDITSKDRVEKDFTGMRLAKLVTSMERYTAKKIIFSGVALQGKKISLEQVSGKWVYSEKPTELEAIGQEKVHAFLDKLSGNRIKEFLSGPQMPKGKESGIEVELIDEKGVSKKKLHFWKLGERLYGQDPALSRPEVFLIDPVLKDALPWTLDHFKSAGQKPADSKVDKK